MHPINTVSSFHHKFKNIYLVKYEEIKNWIHRKRSMCGHFQQRLPTSSSSFYSNHIKLNIFTAMHPINAPNFHHTFENIYIVNYEEIKNWIHCKRSMCGHFQQRLPTSSSWFSPGHSFISPPLILPSHHLLPRGVFSPPRLIRKKSLSNRRRNRWQQCPLSIWGREQKDNEKNGNFDRDYIPPNASHFGIPSQSPGMIDGADLRFQGFQSVSRPALCGFKCNHSLQRVQPFPSPYLFQMMGFFSSSFNIEVLQLSTWNENKG